MLGMSLHQGGRRLAHTEPGKAQAGAVLVLRIGIARRRKCGDRPVAVVRGLAQVCERKPSGREGRRGGDDLLQNVGCGRAVAAGEVVEGPLVAPVDQEVAGGHEVRLHAKSHVTVQSKLAAARL